MIRIYNLSSLSGFSCGGWWPCNWWLFLQHLVHSTVLHSIKTLSLDSKRLRHCTKICIPASRAFYLKTLSSYFWLGKPQPVVSAVACFHLNTGFLACWWGNLTVHFLIIWNRSPLLFRKAEQLVYLCCAPPGRCSVTNQARCRPDPNIAKHWGTLFFPPEIKASVNLEDYIGYKDEMLNWNNYCQ